MKWYFDGRETILDQGGSEKFLGSIPALGWGGNRGSEKYLVQSQHRIGIRARPETWVLESQRSFYFLFNMFLFIFI